MGTIAHIYLVQLKLFKVLKRWTVWLEVDFSVSHSSSILIVTCLSTIVLLQVDEVEFPAIWVCPMRYHLSTPTPSQLMAYLLSPRPPNPVSSSRSHLQCKTISAHEKRQFLQSIDHKLLLENGIIFTKGYSLSSQGPEGNPSFFNNMYV